MKEYLKFREREMLFGFISKKKTDVYDVLNKQHGDLLGMIKWNRGWRQYCFYPEARNYGFIVFSSGCLNSISTFMDEINTKHKKGWKNEISKCTKTI